jgi:tRNA threonylcarbamoyladenosine biosynthesis protein TsaE
MNIFEKLRRGVETHSPEVTRALARELAQYLPAEATLALHGSLGVGKTTFVGGLADAWHIPGPIPSPTFNYYLIHEGTRQLVHLDAYRLDDPSRTASLDIDEFLKPPFCLVVEWPDKVGAWLPADALHLHLSILAPGRHHIRLEDSAA